MTAAARVGAFFAIFISLGMFCPAADAEPTFTICSIRVDGTAFREICRDPDLNFGSPAVSPDGKTIAMDAWPAGGFDPARAFVCLCDTEGKKEGKNYRRLGSGGMPKWSPNGKAIAIQDYYGAGGCVVMNSDGTGRELVVKQAGNPEWYGKTDQLAVLQWGRGGIRVCNLVDGSVRQLQILHDIQHGFSFSPDASQIAAVIGRGESAELTIMTPNDRARPKTVFRGEALGTVGWHPSGKQIVFAVGSDDIESESPAKLVIYDLAGGKSQPITGTGDGVICVNPSFSPDGKSVYFSRKAR